MSDDQVEAPAAVVEAPAEVPAPVEEEPKKAPVKKPAPKKKTAGGWDDLDEDTIHRLYHVPPAGYQKPKFPSSI